MNIVDIIIIVIIINTNICVNKKEKYGLGKKNSTQKHIHNTTGKKGCISGFVFNVCV